MTDDDANKRIQDAVWKGSLPLQITLSPTECQTYDQAESYFLHAPRLSYISTYLDHLHHFFSQYLIDTNVVPHDAWLSFENVPLKWQYPIGLLYDLFSGSAPYQAIGAAIDQKLLRHSPWKLTIHYTGWPDHILVRPDTEGKVFHDAYINNVKEADFLRNGTAKGIMSLSKDDSTALWHSVQTHTFAVYMPVFKRLLYAQGAPLRHVPIKIYLPSTPTSSEPSVGHLKVIQALIKPVLASSKEPNTLGAVLNSLLPTLFPSRRTPVMARPVLHGAVVPMSAPVEELMRTASYLDGWLHIGLTIMD